MIETDKRKAVFLLHQEGQSVREIARLLGLSRNTVRTIITQGGAPPPPHPRADKQHLDEELLRRLYHQCQGWIARVHEKLVEEEGLRVTYSTLKRRYLKFYRAFDRPAHARMGGVLLPRGVGVLGLLCSLGRVSAAGRGRAQPEVQPPGPARASSPPAQSP
jgi:predicted transcriptional regulator